MEDMDFRFPRRQHGKLTFKKGRAGSNRFFPTVREYSRNHLWSCRSKSRRNRSE